MIQQSFYAGSPTPAEPIEKTYLWVNVADLDQMGKIPGFGTPLNLMICPELGDDRLTGAWLDKTRLDELYIVIHTPPARAEAIKEALDMLGKRKMKRAVRTKKTNTPPGQGWRYVPEE